MGCGRRCGGGCEGDREGRCGGGCEGDREGGSRKGAKGMRRGMRRRLGDERPPSHPPSHSPSQPPLHPPSYLHCIFWECEVSLLSKSQTRNIARQIPNDKFRINPTNPTESWRREKVKLDRQQHELLKNKEWTMIFLTFSSKLCCNNGIYPE